MAGKKGGKGDKGGKGGKGKKSAEAAAEKEAEIIKRCKVVDQIYQVECAKMKIPVDAVFLNFIKKNMKDDTGKLLISPDMGINPVQLKAMCLALREDPCLLTLQLWRINCGDAGVSAIMELLRKNNMVNLELLDDRVTPLGCDVLSSLLIKDIKLQYLLLDYNDLGDEGAILLGSGLKWNSELCNLSMAYCKIGYQGACSVAADIIGNSKLKELNMQGNNIGTAGCVAMVDGLRRNCFLESLSLADNSIDETMECMQKIASMLVVNVTLLKLDLRFNMLGAVGAALLLETIKEKPDMQEFKISERISPGVFQELYLVGGGKKKKGKGGKGGKKGKKK